MNRPRQTASFQVPRRRVLISVARSSVTVLLSVVVYYLLPLDHGLDTRTAITLAGSLTLLAGVAVRQVRKVVTSDYPRLRALETMATVGPVFLLIFAAAYEVVSQNRTDSFTETLERTDAMYFAVTVFATVGFGDIAPVTETARVLTTVQMLADVILVGIVARFLVGAIQKAEDARSTDSAGPSGTSHGTPPGSSPGTRPGTEDSG
ncbi:potassium channel family protein [Streptomyces sp. bgisy159]|uniref:potassium channel family protein n=1 Tax=Streptomyces sp. bgisy159 TaxID=3413795 RepID=UPI003F4A1115